jgi:hypothetical protein
MSSARPGPIVPASAEKVTDSQLPDDIIAIARHGDLILHEVAESLGPGYAPRPAIASGPRYRISTGRANRAQALKFEAILDRHRRQRTICGSPGNFWLAALSVTRAFSVEEPLKPIQPDIVRPPLTLSTCPVTYRALALAK